MERRRKLLLGKKATILKFREYCWAGEGDVDTQRETIRMYAASKKNYNTYEDQMQRENFGSQGLECSLKLKVEWEI